MSVRARPSALYIAELCSGSTGDFESLSPGSNPGSAANLEVFQSVLGLGIGKNVNKAPRGLLRQLLVPFNLERVGCQFGGGRGEDK